MLILASVSVAADDPHFDYGTRIAPDDFDTGESSLAHLSRLAIDKPERLLRASAARRGLIQRKSGRGVPL